MFFDSPLIWNNSPDFFVFYNYGIFEECSQWAMFRTPSFHLEIDFWELSFAQTLKGILQYGAPSTCKINRR